jgi:hypothetical protein
MCVFFLKQKYVPFTSTMLGCVSERRMATWIRIHRPINQSIRKCGCVKDEPIIPTTNPILKKRTTTKPINKKTCCEQTDHHHNHRPHTPFIFLF